MCSDCDRGVKRFHNEGTKGMSLHEMGFIFNEERARRTLQEQDF